MHRFLLFSMKMALHGQTIKALGGTLSEDLSTPKNSIKQQKKQQKKSVKQRQGSNERLSLCLLA